MAYLQIGNAVEVSKLPEPPKGGDWSAVLSVPNWVMPTAFAVANGHDHERALNGIGFTEPEGDLLLYRRFTPDDWERYPLLHGIKEAWIVFALSGAD